MHLRFRYRRRSQVVPFSVISVYEGRPPPFKGPSLNLFLTIGHGQLLNLPVGGREVLHKQVRIRDQALIGNQPELHGACVTEDAEAHAHVPGLGNPEHRLLKAAAGQVQRLGWAGDVGHHR